MRIQEKADTWAKHVKVKPKKKNHFGDFNEMISFLSSFSMSFFFFFQMVSALERIPI